jgi:hypothetical protein
LNRCSWRPDDIEGGTLFFEFQRPREVGRDEVREFAVWLMATGCDGETIH